MRIVGVFVVVALVAAACGGSGRGASPPATAVPAATPSLTATVEPSPAEVPSKAAASPTNQAGTPALFEPFDDYTFRPVDDETQRGFAAALTASIEGSGTLGDVQLAEAIRGDEEPVLTAAFSLVPQGTADQPQLLGRVTRAIAGATGEEWVETLGGTAWKLESADNNLVILPWGTLADNSMVFLMTQGPDATAVERVAEGLSR